MTLRDMLVAENIITIAAILAAVTGIILFGGKVVKFFKKAVHFFDDYLGEEERPGVERRPGISERISKIENCLENVDGKFDVIEYKIENIEKELQPNSGTSLRDAINRIENRVKELESNR